MSISLIVGLGNPGKEYQDTRHNLGFMLTDALASSLDASPWTKDKSFDAFTAKATFKGASLRFIKPMTFMNLSGSSVGKVARYYNIPAEQILVIYDDINIPFAQAKLSVGGGGGGHNGVIDMIQHLDDNTFIRFRLGIGHKAHPEMDLKDHVLGSFSSEEKTALTNQLPYLINCLMLLLEKGPVEAMTFVNQKNKINE